MLESVFGVAMRYEIGDRYVFAIESCMYLYLM